MSLGVSVPAKKAQKIKKIVAEENLINYDSGVVGAQGTVIFPLSKKPSALQLKKMRSISREVKLVKRVFPQRKKKPKNLRSALESKLSKAEMKKLIASFDTVGDIAIMEIPEELIKKEKVIGNALLQVNKNVKVVCKKAGIHSGIYRVQKLKVIAGEQRTKANYTESGCKFKVTLDRVFFSIRLGTERLRIAKLIKKGEIVAGLFAGAGPFPIVFAKNSPMEKSYAVELNPLACKEMSENIELNKVEGKIEAIGGDVKKVVPAKLRGRCDRVVMPLPKGGESFLKEAIMCIKPSGGTVHFYQFVRKDNPYTESLERIKKAAEQAGRKSKILRKEQVRTFSPAIIQIVIDFKIF